MIKKLWTSNVLVGTSSVNGLIMGLSLIQILTTVSLFGFTPIPSLSLFWWPSCDAFRVFISCCLRMDFLLRELLDGQEFHLTVLRRILVVVNCIGFILALCVFAYKPFMTAEPLEFFILTISVLCFHVLTSIPTLSYLWKGQDIVRSRRPESEDPLLETTERSHITADELVPRESTNESNYISPFPQTVRFTGEDLLADIPNQDNSAVARISSPALEPEPNPRLTLMQQQDNEYEAMLADQIRTNEATTEHVIEPMEVKSAASIEPDAQDPFAVEMRVMTPNGTQVSRRFDRQATLTLILKWVESTLSVMKIPHEKGVRLCERFPRKVYGSSDYERTLENLNFWRAGKPAPQRSSVLILEVI